MPRTSMGRREDILRRELCQVAQSGSDRLPIVEGNLEPFELRSKRRRELAVLTDFEQAFQEIPAQEPLAGIAPRERFVHRWKLPGHRCRAARVREPGAFVEVEKR